MFKNMINCIVSSFSRTLGRFLFYILLALLILLLFGGKVNAETYNPRYATLNGSYLWQDGKMITGNRLIYGITDGSNARVNFCISPSFYRDIDMGDYDSYYYGYIESCTTGLPGRAGWWQASGTGYAQLEAAIDFTDSCVVDGHTGHKQRIYFHLLDFTTPSGGADFSWSCFQLANDNYLSGYYNVAQINDIVLTEKSYSKEEKEKQDEINRENQSLNNQQTIINQNTEAETTRKGIWQSLKDGISSIGSWFTQLGDKIGGFFDNLLNGIIEGLKSLFVPTEEQLQEIIDKSSELAENFGFVGETIDFFIDIFTSLMGMVNGEGCITLPKFEIGETSLFDAHTFWEEQTTCLADNKILNDNIDTIRTITSISLVCLFLGFASKQFFKILSKSESESDKE